MPTMQGEIENGGESVERCVLTLVGNVVDILVLEDFRFGLLSALHETVPSDIVSFNEVSPDPSLTFALADPPLGESSHEAFGRFAHENPILTFYQRTGSGRATRFSDVSTVEELHATDLYKEVYRPLGVEHQIAFTLPSPADFVLGIALSRREHDFSDFERDLLNLARPFLIQAYQNAITHSRLLAGEAKPPTAATGREERASERLPLAPLMRLGLSEREAEVLRLVAMGRSDRAAANELSISPRTVQKHLERCYATLGVHSRSAAAQIVWRVADVDGGEI
ncbi:MAG TPA: LuxR C-terminal-related transcriptional regulator [Solirubrobacteraceae bacterium]|jgi:DNA-binding CsgD family transcriptional regulator